MRPGESPSYPSIPAELRGDVLRGIGGTATEPRSSAGAMPRGANELERLAAALEGPHADLSVELVRLVHRD